MFDLTNELEQSILFFAAVQDEMIAEELANLPRIADLKPNMCYYPTHYVYNEDVGKTCCREFAELPSILSCDTLEPPVTSASIQILLNTFTDSLPAGGDAIRSVYHYAIPTTKLYYPEPFIAAPSFLHTDLWFSHISVYMYGLGFIFCFLITFFFVTFVCTLRGCNPRMRPRRETRGVSRSKCGDLITAIVPVSGATSIIIHESTDSIDLYDGSGTNELSVGIRAYQGGGEYYYPRTIDLNHRLRSQGIYSLGNSYANTPNLNHLNDVHRFINEYQARGEDGVNESAAAIFLPHLNPFGFPFFDLSQSGRNTKLEISAFQSMHQFTKHVQADLISAPFFNTSSLGFESLFFDESNSYNIAANRPHQFMSNFAVLNGGLALSDIRSFQTLKALGANGPYNPSFRIDSYTSANSLPDGKEESLSAGVVLQSHIFNFRPLFGSSQISNYLIGYAKAINKLALVNVNSDAPAIDNPVEALSFYHDYFSCSQLPNFSQASVVNPKATLSFLLFKTYKNMPGSTPQLGSRTVRSFANDVFESNNVKRDFYKNAISEQLKPLFSGVYLKPSSLLAQAANGFTSATVSMRNAHVEFTLPARKPITSNNAYSDVRDYDLLQNSSTPIIRLFHGREDMISESVSDIYKESYLASDSWAWRLSNASDYFGNSTKSNGPLHHNYFDVDFRRGSMNQIAEDMHGDSYFSSQNFDVLSDYYFNPEGLDSNRDKFVRYLFTLYLTNLLKHAPLAFAEMIKLMSKPSFISEYPVGSGQESPRVKAKQNFLPSQSDDGILSSQRTARLALGHAFLASAASATVEDAFTAGKNSALKFSQQNVSILNRNTGLLRAQNFLSFFDSFSMSYDSPSLSATPFINSFEFLKTDLNQTFSASFKSEKSYNRGFNSLYFPHPLFISYFVRYVRSRVNTSKVMIDLYFGEYANRNIAFVQHLGEIKNLILPGTNDRQFYIFCADLTSAQTAKAKAFAFFNTENISLLREIQIQKLAASVDGALRTSAVTKMLSNIVHAATGYNAIQKVYRTQFDEARSNVRLRDFSMSYQPLYRLSEIRANFMSLVKKNSDSHYQPVFAKAKTHGPLSTLYAYQSLLSAKTFDFPFKLAIKSDPARYLWIDWGTNWGVVDIQPASFSKYALYGLPVFSKAFEFSAPENESFTEGENYLTRLARARRSLLSSGVTSPYFYAKSNHWFVNNNIMEMLEGVRGNLKYFGFACDICFEYLTNTSESSDLSDDRFAYFFPAVSLNGSPARKAWFTTESVNSYYYHGTKLSDILTKREYLFRDLLISRNSLIKIPFNYAATPRHPLFKDLRSGLMFQDSMMSQLERTRGVFAVEHLSFEYFAVKSFYEYMSTFCPYASVTNFLMGLILAGQQTPAQNSGLDEIAYRTDISRRSQYRSIKRGASNMVRLHATGAMALPVCSRLHIFASSRDVIHSWAIPSAGIKIDCIPGFSSHRMAYFISTGIFGGQCMEVCGRYHHGMPIVVYFMKRDIFLLWCAHFIFLKADNDVLELLEQHTSDYVRTVSHDSENGAIELN